MPNDRLGLAVAVVLVALVGCATRPPPAPRMWSRKGTTEAQFNQDSARCRMTARGVPSRALPYRPVTPGEQLQQAGRELEDAENFSATFRDCMLAEGYTYR